MISCNKFQILFYLYLIFHSFNCHRLMIIENGRYLNSTYFSKEIKSAASITRCAIICNILTNCHSLNVFRENPLICQFFEIISGDFVYHEDATYIRYFNNGKYQDKDKIHSITYDTAVSSTEQGSTVTTDIQTTVANTTTGTEAITKGLSTEQEKGTTEDTSKEKSEAAPTTVLAITTSTESFSNTVQPVSASTPSLSPVYCEGLTGFYFRHTLFKALVNGDISSPTRTPVFHGKVTAVVENTCKGYVDFPETRRYTFDYDKSTCIIRWEDNNLWKNAECPAIDVPSDACNDMTADNYLQLGTLTTLQVSNQRQITGNVGSDPDFNGVVTLTTKNECRGWVNFPVDKISHFEFERNTCTIHWEGKERINGNKWINSNC